MCFPSLRKTHTNSQPVCAAIHPLQSSRRWKKFSCTKRPSSRTCWFLFGHPSSGPNGRWRLRQVTANRWHFFLLKIQGSETKRRIGQQLAKNQEDETDNAFVEKHASCLQCLQIPDAVDVFLLDCYLLCLFFYGPPRWQKMGSKMKSPLGHVSNETNQGVV